MATRHSFFPFVCGAILGAGAAWLLTTQRGAEVREDLGRKAQQLLDELAPETEPEKKEAEDE